MRLLKGGELLDRRSQRNERIQLVSAMLHSPTLSKLHAIKLDDGTDQEDILGRIQGSNHFTTSPHQWTSSIYKCDLPSMRILAAKDSIGVLCKRTGTDEIDPHPRLSLRFWLLGLRPLARARAAHDGVCSQSSHLPTFGRLSGTSVGGIIEQSICKAHLVQSLSIHTSQPEVNFLFLLAKRDKSEVAKV